MGLGPHQRQAARDDSGIGFVACQSCRIIDAVGLQRLQLTLGALTRALASFREHAPRTLAAIKRGGGYGEAAVPVLIKDRGELSGDGTCRENVVIGELGIRVHLKVLIADISAADERNGIVDEQQLVVHSIVESGGVQHEFDRAPQVAVAAIDERIEYPNLDVWMCVQRADLLVARDRVAVVDQHPHPHATIGGPHQGIGEQPAGLVAAKDEILKIQRLLRGTDHLRAHQESINTDGDDSKSGIAVAPARGIVKLRAEVGLLGMSQRDGRGLRGVECRWNR